MHDEQDLGNKNFELKEIKTTSEVEQPEEVHLLSLPLEILRYIVSYLTPKDKASASQSCKLLYNFFQLDLDKIGAEKLLTYVLQGKGNEVLEMAKINPKLFFIKATAMDYAMDLEGNRRTMEDWSPYQAMFGTGDKLMLKSVKTYLEAYLKSLPNGNELLTEQEQEKFPNGFDYPPSTYDFSPIVMVITNDQTLIQTGNPSAATEEVLAKFRKDFMPGVMKDGFHFNVNDLDKACDVYQDNWQWNGNQLSLWWCQVIAFLERLVTAFDAQVISQGIATLEGKKELRRGNDSFDFHNYVTGEKTSYFPLDLDPNCRLGLHFGVHPALVARAGAWGWPGGFALSLLKNYVKQKQETVKNLSRSCDNIETLVLDETFGQ